MPPISDNPLCLHNTSRMIKRELFFFDVYVPLLVFTKRLKCGRSFIYLISIWQARNILFTNSVWIKYLSSLAKYVSIPSKSIQYVNINNFWYIAWMNICNSQWSFSRLLLGRWCFGRCICYFWGGHIAGEGGLYEELRMMG